MTYKDRAIVSQARPIPPAATRAVTPQRGVPTSGQRSDAPYLLVSQMSRFAEDLTASLGDNIASAIRGRLCP
jgi:hypothetical protein